MSVNAEFHKKLSKIGALADDEQAIDELLEVVEKPEASDEMMEEGDQVPEVINAVTYSDLEYDIKHNEYITNPAQTWDFAKAVTIIFPHSLKGVVNAVKYAEENHLKIRGLGSRHSFSLAPATDDCYIDLSKTYKYSPGAHNQTVYSLDQDSLQQLKEGINEKWSRFLNTSLAISTIMATKKNKL